MKYIFYISKTYSITIIDPLIMYLNQKNGEYRFYISEKVQKQFPMNWDNKLIIKSIKEARLYNPDFVLSPGNFVDFRIPGKKVQLFHGLGVEKEVHYKIRHFFDIYLTSGPYVTEQYNRLKDRHKSFLVYETGWSKIDYILRYSSNSIRENLGIPAGKRIILYAPTFSRLHESASLLVDTIPKIIKDDEYWIFKFHELMDKQIITNFKTLDVNKCRVLENVEITPYLHLADLMISDTSSVIYEFMVLDKPVITINTEKREKGINITSGSELRNALDRSFENPSEFKKIRQKNISEINPYLDGKTSNRIFQVLEDISKNNIKPAKSKPLNLFRKLQIFYHSLFKRGYMR